MAIHNKKKVLILASITLIIVTAFQLLKIIIIEDNHLAEMINNISIRVICGSAVLFLIWSLHIKLKNENIKLLSTIIILAPAILISINNFPISAYLNGRVSFEHGLSTIILYLFECLSIGFFEEIVFRGLILLVILERLKDTKLNQLKAIILSSFFFGLIHILNLFYGASVLDTMTQIGYSFLMGAMWSVIFLVTRNIYYIILLHASYNFFGFVAFQYGTVVMRYDTFTIIITTTLAIFALLFYLKLFIKLKEDDLNEFYNRL